MSLIVTLASRLLLLVIPMSTLPKVSNIMRIASSASSHAKDLFGSTMNICAKINSKAEPNGIVIGDELYRLMKSLSFQEYLFKEIDGYHVANRSYPLYSLTHIAKHIAKKDEEGIKKNPFKSEDGLE